MKSLWRLKVLAAFTAAVFSAHAQTSPPLRLSLEPATQRLLEVSDSLSAADANVRGNQTLSAAAGHLRSPDIALDAALCSIPVRQ